MKTNNIFSNQMKICRPVFMKQFRAVPVNIVSDSGNIICQCVQPYIDDMFRIKVNRNSPLERSSGNTEILKPRKKKIVHHLIFSGNRLNKLRVLIDILDQAVCVFAHLEEIRLFLSRRTRATAVRAFTIHKLGLCKE